MTSFDRIAAFLSTLDKPPDGIPCGFGAIDRATGGFRSGTVCVIGARPATGKTSFALNFACNGFLPRRKNCILFSLEMSAETIYERIAAITTGIQYNKIIRRKLSDDEKARITAEIRDTAENLTVIDDIYDIENIDKAIETERPAVTVIDYIQITQTAQKTESTKQRIDIISAKLKETAKKCGCVIIALSQISRQGKDAPTMSDLKESGALEQDADYVILLHRPNITDKAADQAETVLTLDKNRYGSCGRTRLIFQAETQRFYEAQKSAERI